jgi:hypothetical protein
MDTVRAVLPRPDFSEYVVHFTKSAPPFGLARRDTPRVHGLAEIAPLSAYDRLVAMLEQETIKATNMPWTDKPCVCFTECVWGSLLDHAERYSTFGIGFHKKTLFEAGGGPAIYMRQDLFRAAAARGIPDEVWPFITPFVPEYSTEAHRREHWDGRTPCDYTHEREWRVPHDFTFQLSDVEFPRATSLSMSLSSSFSANSRFSRAFSFSKAFSRTTSSGRIALNCARQRW